MSFRFNKSMYPIPYRETPYTPDEPRVTGRRERPKPKQKAFFVPRVNKELETLLLTGLTRTEIATKLNLPEHTVRYQSICIYRAANVRDRYGLMAKFIQKER